jgi:hypothetical protein
MIDLERKKKLEKMPSNIVHGGITLLKNASINILSQTNIQYKIFTLDMNKFEGRRRKEA